MTVKATWKKDMEFQMQYPGGEIQPMVSIPLAQRPAEGPSPMDVVLGATAGCTGMDVVSILQKMRKVPTSFRIEVESRRAEEHPKVFTDIQLTYHFEGPALDEAAVSRAVQLSQEKYCSVAAMLRPTVTMSYRIVLNGKAVEAAPQAP